MYISIAIMLDIPFPILVLTNSICTVNIKSEEKSVNVG